MVPSTLTHPNAPRFWFAVLITGVGAGVGAAALTRLLEATQRLIWLGNGVDLLDAASRAPWARHVLALLGAGVLTGLGQLALKRLTSGNGIDISEAIWFRGGRLPAVRTLGSAVLSVLIVGMGASLGREGAPKQVGAVVANLLSDGGGLSDEERKLLVACGAGGGMAAAYGVPVGGALFALEVLRGVLALRFVLPALVVSLVASVIAWAVLPNAPTYVLPAYQSSLSTSTFAVFIGVIAGPASVAYVRAIAWADRHKPTGWQRVLRPALILGLLGVASIPFPQLLGNGKDVAALAFWNRVDAALLFTLAILKPAATTACIVSGAPGGLFTPSLSFGALLGGALGHAWSLVWPGGSTGLFAFLGAGAVLAATTQGPLSTVVLMMELTGKDRSFVVPLLLAVASATLVARSIEPRSIYDARLSDEQVAERQKMRDAAVLP